MKTGLVLEGGAMRGMFTAGVLDVMMENGIQVDGAIGVSAGAVFGCNYKSGQIGRVIRYNKQFCNDPRYVSVRSLIFTGDLYNERFCYERVPRRLDVFDTEAFVNSPMEFYAVATDVDTGKAVYHRCTDGGEEDIRWLQASASMPMVSRVVRIGEHGYLDGGVADSIPVKAFEEMGYRHNIIVLTQPLDFVKPRNSALPLIRIAMRKYPRIVQDMELRHLRYNRTTRYVRDLEERGKALVIRPPEALNISQVEHDPAELQRVYDMGRAEAERRLAEIRSFVGQSDGNG